MRTLFDSLFQQSGHRDPTVTLLGLLLQAQSSGRISGTLDVCGARATAAFDAGETATADRTRQLISTSMVHLLGFVA